VNVNKVATLRNSRGGVFPSPLHAVEVCLAAGAGGITVHPRADERHIRADDVREIGEMLRAPRQRGVEYNIEGDPSAAWLTLVHELRPDQATLVPVRPGEITSEAGWREDTDAEWMSKLIAELKADGIRVSMFCDANLAAVQWAKRMGADRVELYTEPFAAAFAQGIAQGQAMFDQHRATAEHAHGLGLGVNAGHDLDLDNLVLYRRLPHLAEVSIGHALIGRAVFEGLDHVVREYLEVLAG
jgi:pyridoxine 5-phosphate synthase